MNHRFCITAAAAVALVAEFAAGVPPFSLWANVGAGICFVMFATFAFFLQKVVQPNQPV